MIILPVLVLSLAGVSGAAELTLEGFLADPVDRAQPGPMAELMESVRQHESVRAGLERRSEEAMIERTASGPRLDPTGGVVSLVEWAEDEGVGLRKVRLVKSDAPSVYFNQRPTVHFGAAPAASAVITAAAPRKAVPPQCKPSVRRVVHTRFGKTGPRSLTGLRGVSPAAAQVVGAGVGYAQSAAQATAQGPAVIGTIAGAPAQVGPQVEKEDPMKNKNTNMIEYLCEGNKCRPGKRPGETIVDYEDGYSLTHSYDQSQEYGLRNTYVYRDPKGQTFTLKGSPLVFDLKGAGVRASDRRLRYDIDGDGRTEIIHDISSGGGLLVFDADHDGVSGSRGLELFGDNTDLDGDGKKDGFADGFEALWGMARRGVRQGVLRRRVLERARLGPRDLAALEKAYGLKIRVGGLARKAVSLRQAGIVSIALSREASRMLSDFDGQANDVARREGALFTRADGSQGSYEDIWFAFPKVSPNVALAAR